MKRFIAVTTEQREFLMKTFRVDVRTVRNALSYSFDSNTCKRIRKLALQRGGVMMCTAKEIETIHDADGVMKQLLPNGAVIEIDKKTGDAVVYIKGEPRIHVENIRVREIGALQKSAMALK